VDTDGGGKLKMSSSPVVFEGGGAAGGGGAAAGGGGAVPGGGSLVVPVGLPLAPPGGDITVTYSSGTSVFLDKELNSFCHCDTAFLTYIIIKLYNSI
jgi:hypothetical protein